MPLPNLKPDASLPSAFDDRSSSEAAIDMAAASVYGALEILSRVIERYMEEVREAASEDVAGIYAQKLRDAAA